MVKKVIVPCFLSPKSGPFKQEHAFTQATVHMKKLKLAALDVTIPVSSRISQNGLDVTCNPTHTKRVSGSIYILFSAEMIRHLDCSIK